MIVEEYNLNGNGDFRSDEVTRLRDEADIICTNPPFSLFRDFLAWINPDEKKFLILGTIVAAGWSEVFPLIKNNQIWLGVTSNKTLQFQLPDDAEKYKTVIGDKKYAEVPSCTWFTNIDNVARHSEIPYLTMEQHTMLGNRFNKYENFDAIDVNKCTDIPIDYTGTIGVPISFLSQYNPDRFELIGVGAGNLAKEAGITVNHRGRTDLYYIDSNGKPNSPFARVLIRRRFE